MTGLSDSFCRPIDYLRLSVTDRCNLRCRYCLPEEGVPLIPRQQILSLEELARVARATAELGITKIRLTGGEPLVRDGLFRLIGMLSAINGVDDLALTTNGILLARHVASLKAAGLKRVNVSLDSLKPERFEYITRRGDLKQVLSGIDAARSAGLDPVKINMVVMRTVNDDEVLDFAERTVSEAWHVRFIELMPFYPGTDFPGRFIGAPEIEQRLRERFGELAPSERPQGNGPARYFRIAGAEGTIGFITPVSQHFCVQCNRLRLTASGRLRTCLFSDEETDLLGPIRRGDSLEQIKELIRLAIQNKPRQHHLGEGIKPAGSPMSRVGG